MSADYHIRTAGIALGSVTVPAIVGYAQPILGLILTILAIAWYAMEITNSDRFKLWRRQRRHHKWHQARRAAMQEHKTDLRRH